jgi:hypothetical protein
LGLSQWSEGAIINFGPIPMEREIEKEAKESDAWHFGLSE